VRTFQPVTFTSSTTRRSRACLCSKSSSSIAVRTRWAQSCARWRSWLSRASSRRCVVSAARHIESRRRAQRSLADAGISMMSMSPAW